MVRSEGYMDVIQNIPNTVGPYSEYSTWQKCPNAEVLYLEYGNAETSFLKMKLTVFFFVFLTFSIFFVFLTFSSKRCVT